MNDPAAEDVPELTAAQLEQLVAALDRAELRPSLLVEFAPETLNVYRRRFKHYARWCLSRGLQPAADAIDSAKINEYVRAQIGLGLLRPATLRVALAALLVYAERSGAVVPDVRQARSMIASYRALLDAAGVPPAHQVLHRDKRPRARRRTAVEGI